MVRIAVEEALRVLARAEVDALAELCGSRDAAARHLTMFVLGHARDAGAVPALLRVLVHQQDDFDHDWFDHDWAFEAIAQLGPVALEPLARVALEGGDTEAEHATQALGQCHGPGVWPQLERIHRQRRPLPRGFYAAC
ncbi:MAG: hypothetical protein AB7O97_00800 [Planctomycetota bacterium]